MDGRPDHSDRCACPVEYVLAGGRSSRRFESSPPQPSLLLRLRFLFQHQPHRTAPALPRPAGGEVHPEGNRRRADDRTDGHESEKQRAVSIWSIRRSICRPASTPPCATANAISSCSRNIGAAHRSSATARPPVGIPMVRRPISPPRWPCPGPRCRPIWGFVKPTLTALLKSPMSGSASGSGIPTSRAGQLRDFCVGP